MTERKNARKVRIHRALMIVALMLVVCLASVGGTLAWLQAQTEPIVNTFAATGIELELTEENPADRNDIKLVPGVDIVKDPKVSASCDVPYYVFVKVTDANWPENYVTYSIADGWTALGGVDGVYYKELAAGSLEPTSILAGDKVSVSADMTVADMDKITDDPTLTFKAYAIQKEGFANAAAAWDEISGTSGN